MISVLLGIAAAVWYSLSRSYTIYTINGARLHRPRAVSLGDGTKGISARPAFWNRGCLRSHGQHTEPALFAVEFFSVMLYNNPHNLVVFLGQGISPRHGPAHERSGS